jgi:hypothetical protein
MDDPYVEKRSLDDFFKIGINTYYEHVVGKHYGYLLQESAFTLNFHSMVKPLLEYMFIGYVRL